MPQQLAIRRTLHSEQYLILVSLLREAREAVGMTQTTLAERLGVEQTVISKCERGGRRLDVIELHQWLSALGHEPAQFVEVLYGKLEAAAVTKRKAGRSSSPKR